MQRADYVQMAANFLAIVSRELVAGLALGIVIVWVAFALENSRLRLMKMGLNLAMATRAKATGSTRRKLKSSPCTKAPIGFAAAGLTERPIECSESPPVHPPLDSDLPRLV